MAKLYAKDIVVRIPDGEYFAMPISERRHRVSDRQHFANGCADWRSAAGWDWQT